MPGNIGLRVSYMGSTMRKLLNDRDFNTLQASTVPFDPSVPEDYARLPFPLYNYYMDIVDNRGERPVQRAAVGSVAPLQNGLALNAAYTLSHSDSNAPDTGNSDDRSGAVRSVRHRKGPWSRSEHSTHRVRGERDVGRTGRPRPEARREHGRVVGRAVRRVDGLSVVPGAQRAAPHAVLQRLLHDEPMEHGQAARRPGHCFLLRVASGPD